MIDRRMFKGTNVFYFLFESIKWELRELDQFIEETAINLKDKQDKLEDYYNKVKAETNLDNPAFDMYFTDEFHRYETLFPTYTFNSLLVTQFSFLERHLREICKAYENKSYSKVKLKDLYGSDIDKCKKFLTLIAEMDFEPIRSNWERIKVIQEIRNAIVHHSSQIEKSNNNQSFLNHIKLEPLIDYSETPSRFFIRDVQFLKDFSQVILTFFNHLTEALATSKVLVKNSTMPYNNDVWGKEKSLNILENLTICVELISKSLESKDSNTFQEILEKVHSSMNSMVYDSTKLFAFFSDINWEAKDRDAIMLQGRKGLEELKKIYK